MERMIRNAEELMIFFQEIIRVNSKGGKQHPVEAMVDTKVRKDVLCSVGQGKFVAVGRVRRIGFENLGGGVYKAFEEEL